MDGDSLQVDYVSSDELALRPPAWWAGVLGVVGFEKPPLAHHPGVPITASMTPSLGSQAARCEVWRLMGDAIQTETLTPSARGTVQYRRGGELLFGSLTVDELRFEGNASAALRGATYDAYEQVFALLKKTQYPHLIRVWNYVPDINGEADGEERYRHFNAARQAAFNDCGRSTTGAVPAASALGSLAGNPISIYFLAARKPPTMIENPRQISAYFYPPKFGVHSPTFSRACLSNSAGTNLFVSGTASIVGSETLHHGNVTAQTFECLANIASVLHEANRIVNTPSYSLDGLHFKVYVRHSTDLDAVRAVLSSSLEATTPVVYLQADVCRADLLVEIEAAGVATPH